MGADAEQSRRGWRRHLRGVSRDRAAKSGRDAERGTLLFSARELGVLAINGLEWTLYVLLTWGLIYLVFTDKMPKSVQARQPIHWLDASPPATSDLSTCAALIEDASPSDPGLSPEFKKGFEAAIQVMLDKVERVP